MKIKRNKNEKQINDTILCIDDEKIQISCNELSLDYINNRINKEYNETIFNRLSDETLSEKYKETESFKRKYINYEKVFKKHIPNISDDTIKDIINELNIVPHGTKGVIRGNEFNNIVKEFISNHFINNDNYKIIVITIIHFSLFE